MIEVKNVRRIELRCLARSNKMLHGLDVLLRNEVAS